MPQGIGTYGTKKGRPPKKKMPRQGKGSKPNPFSASGNVKVGCVHKNVGVHRQFDVRVPHIQLSPPYSPELFINAGAYNGGLFPYTKNGSKTVKTNGVQTARLYSPVICSSFIIKGVVSSVKVGV